MLQGQGSVAWLGMLRAIAMQRAKRKESLLNTRGRIQGDWVKRWTTDVSRRMQPAVIKRMLAGDVVDDLNGGTDSKRKNTLTKCIKDATWWPR